MRTSEYDRWLGARLLGWAAFVVSLLAAFALSAHAQSFSPIPNYTGPTAGYQFRSAINNALSGASPISSRIVNETFSSLPAEQDGFLIYRTAARLSRWPESALPGSAIWVPLVIPTR